MRLPISPLTVGLARLRAKMMALGCKPKSVPLFMIVTSPITPPSLQCAGLPAAQSCSSDILLSFSTLRGLRNGLSSPVFALSLATPTPQRLASPLCSPLPPSFTLTTPRTRSPPAAGVQTQRILVHPSVHCVPAARAGARTWRRMTPALHCVPTCVLPPGAVHTNASAARCRCVRPAPTGQPPPPVRAVPGRLLCPSWLRMTQRGGGVGVGGEGAGEGARDEDGDGEGSSDNKRDSAPSAFPPPPFIPTSPFLPDASATSAFPSLGPPFSAVHVRHSPPPQSPFSSALASPYPTLAVRPPAAAATLRRARTTHALTAQVQPGQALMLPSLMHMYKCSLSAPCRAFSPSPSPVLAPPVAPPVGHEYAQYAHAHAHVQHRASAMRTRAVTRCHSRSHRQPIHGQLGFTTSSSTAAQAHVQAYTHPPLFAPSPWPELDVHVGPGRAPRYTGTAPVHLWWDRDRGLSYQIGRWNEQATWDWNGDEDGDDDGRGSVSRCMGPQRTRFAARPASLEDPAE
ncbi:hypothetical protein B0H14DRAFT_3855259 [Mycena olivaceomarginata]|nr:hypothetical protein B0H14DRAFT_3855259 [Mycena olivaceomarginata]